MFCRPTLDSEEVPRSGERSQNRPRATPPVARPARSRRSARRGAARPAAAICPKLAGLRMRRGGNAHVGHRTLGFVLKYRSISTHRKRGRCDRCPRGRGAVQIKITRYRWLTTRGSLPSPATRPSLRDDPAYPVGKERRTDRLARRKAGYERDVPAPARLSACAAASAFLIGADDEVAFAHLPARDAQGVGRVELAQHQGIALPADELLDHHRVVRLVDDDVAAARRRLERIDV